MKYKRSLKILHVVGAMNRAGTETMLMNMYRKMDRKRLQFDFISYDDKEADYDHEIKKLGGRVIELANTNSIMALYKAIKQHGPYDAIHAHTLFHCGIAVIAAYLAGIKIRISHAHTMQDNSKGFIRKCYMLIMRLIINSFSTNFLACSNGAGRFLFGKKRLHSSRYLYFPNAVDYSEFVVEPHVEVNKFKIKEGLEKSLIIGHIGMFKEAKNHAFLLEIMKNAVKKDPASKLLLVGDGHLKQQIEEIAKKKLIYQHIKFVGVRDDISTMLHCMDVFVFPSLYEGLGLVLLEAQACGIPSIVSEAIQPEADLGLDLVSQLTLADGPEVWADRIMELAGNKERDIPKIITSFEKNGYALTSAISTLLKIYRSDSGGANEGNIDHVF